MASIPTATAESATAAPATTVRPTRIVVAVADGRARIAALAQGHLLAARPLAMDGRRVRIALVGINMALLAGDELSIELHVGAGATLEVIEPTGLVAYDADGRRATWHLDATVDAGATLIWRGAPFVAARGSNASRFTRLALAPDARVLLRETLVLGRSGESAVCLRSRTDVVWADATLLAEDLVLDEETGALPGIVAPAKAIGTVLAAGWRPPGNSKDPHRLDMSGPGAVFRTLESATHHADAMLQPVFDDWYRDMSLPSCCP